MPRTYTRKSNKSSYGENQLIAALEAVRSGRKIREVGRSFGIPESTLRDRLKITDAKKGKLGRKPVFSETQEEELTRYILKLSKMFFGITPEELRKLVFTYAEENHLKHMFNAEKKMAGKDWLSLFMKRNGQVRLRQPEATSINRITAFNLEEVKLFFNNIETVMNKYHFTQDRIYNTDETGITTVQKPVKILGEKGQKRVGSVTSWERGKTVTIVCAISASGSYVPPMFIFPRKRMTEELQRNGPAGAFYRCSDNGWITETLFTEWLKHFQHHAKPSKEEPVLLILDNHSSHISLASYDLCKNNGIVLVSIPPHTSHRLQPLDLAFYGPLKKAYNKQCDIYMRAHPLEKITHYKLAEIFNLAYLNVATMDKAISGFKAAGIFPYDPDKFNDELFGADEAFVPVLLDENPQPNISSEDPNNEVNLPHIGLDDSIPGPSHRLSQFLSNNLSSSVSNNSKQSSSCSASVSNNSRSSQSTLPFNLCKNVVESKGSSSALDISIEEIAPLPDIINIHTTKKSNKRQSQHSAILTSTPMKIALEETEQKRQKRMTTKVNKKFGNTIKNKSKNKIRTANIKRVETQRNKNIKKKQSHVKKIKFDDSSTTEESLDETQICNDDELDDVDVNSNENICVICGEFGKDKELWYRCTLCSGWAHAECSDADGPKDYICDNCKQ